MDSVMVNTAVEQAVKESNAFTISIWFLIGAALVFFMQCGFAMVETGFTRAKNAGNIIMKNLMDFCIGTIMFIFLGFGLMMSEDYVLGIIGVPNLDIFTNFNNFPWSSFVFNLIFCATAATIVSGAMAERTKFISYCIYSGLISLVVYPIEAGWVWNSQGWLAQMGFVDFAGSACIHSVGGISALIGAAMVGPRIGKYSKSGKPRAIPGHSLTLGALGVFILWFGWYGFNGAAATDVTQLAQIFATTTVAPAAATCATMIYTWIKNGKPDVSMSLNGSLAGLVAITAGCHTVDILGSLIIGIVAGILVVIAVEFVDSKLKVDDPVGAVAVHMCNGIWGTLAVGIFSKDEATLGLLYGGGFAQLGKQTLGILCIGAYTAVFMTIIFFAIKKTIGLRASKEEEVKGLDLTEHGLASSYADFMQVPQILTGKTSNSPTVPPEKAVEVNLLTPVEKSVDKDRPKLTNISIVTRQSKFTELNTALTNIGITGMTVTQVLGCGTQKGNTEFYRGVEIEMNLLPKIRIDIVVSKIPVKTVVDTAVKALYTGHIGDGKIFIYDVEDVVKIRTGETGFDALQDHK